ncbi:MAG: HAMP domain-containing histidine kinase [Peptococcaceae bacterium]|nr:HAMP domain-containing histidine kinase [Peptococcaceae bacterium]
MGKKFLASLSEWKKSLIGQLLVRFWVCHILFFTIIGSIQYNSLKDSLYLSVEQNLYSDYQSIKNNMMTWFLNSKVPPERLAELRPGNFVAFYSINNKLNFMIYSYGRPQEGIPECLHEPLSFDLYDKAISNEPFLMGNSKENRYMLLVKPVLSSNYIPYVSTTPEDPLSKFMQKNITVYFPIIGYAVIGEPLYHADSILEGNFYSYVFNALIILLISTVLTALALQKPLEPLLAISSTARKIAGGRYDLRLPAIKTSSEIMQLREALNHMLCQMENALNTERQAKDRMARFIADASHELRTPLTSIRGFLEILLRNKNLDQNTLDSAHQTMLVETERLIRLAEGLLALNRISQEEPGQEEPAFQTTLQDVLPEVVPLFATLLENRSLLLNGQNLKDINEAELPLSTDGCDQALPLKADELKQILYNLINNAIQHTEKDGLIEIITSQDKANFSFTIKDNGKGIPAEDLPHVFDRFFRGDRSRSHAKSQSCGLGLAIVSELIRLRGGKITVQSLPGAGASFTVIFPVKTV